MKMTRKWLSVLLCVVMAVAAFVVTTNAAGGATNVAIAVEKTEVNVGDTFTVTFGNKAMTVKGFSAGFTFDKTLLECVSIVGVDPEYPDDYSLMSGGGRGGIAYTKPTAYSTVEKANASGTVGYAYIGTSNITYLENTLYIVTFKAKAAGTANFTLYEETNGTDAFKSDSIETKTVTIKAAHTCTLEHVAEVKATCSTTGNIEYWYCSDAQCGKYFSDANGVNEITDKESVNTAIDPNNHDWNEPTYTWSADGKTCTAERTCKRDGSHKETETVKATGVVTTEGKCNVPEVVTYTATFDVDWAETQTNPVTGEKNPDVHAYDGETGYYKDNGDGTHSFICGPCGQPVEGKTEAHDKAGQVYQSGNCRVPETVGCSKCPAVIEYSTNPDVHAAVSSICVDNEDGATHTVKWPCCDKVVNAAELHNYTTDTPAYTCICGDVEQFTVYWYDWNSNDLGESLVDYGAPLPAGPAIPEIPEGSYGLGWHDRFEGSSAPETMPANSLHLIYVIQQYKYTVTFLYENGETWKVATAFHGDVIKDLAKMYPYPDAKEGHTFIGWGVKNAETGKIELVTQMTVTGNLTLYPIFEVNTYTLTLSYLDDKGENAEMTVQVPFGTKLSELAKVLALPKTFTVDNTAGANLEDIYAEVGTYELNGWAAGTTGNMLGLTEAKFQNLTMPAMDYCLQAEYRFTGWLNYYGDGWEYFIRSKAQPEGWIQVDGAWYYLKPATDLGGNEIFIRAEGLTRVPYPTEKIDGITYVPDQEALDYCAGKGETFIDATKAWFLFDENGKFMSGTTGMGTYEGATRYMVNGMLKWHPGLIKIGEEYYYFIGDTAKGGNIAADGDTYITYNNGIEGFLVGDIYNFTNGKLSGLNGVVNGKYYENSKLMVGAGLVKLGDNYIYVRSNGQVVVNAEYYVAENNLGIVAALYKFDENGFMVEPKSTGVNGIVDGYYYENGKIVYGAGLVKYNGGYIYVRSSGEVVMDRSYWITNTNGLMDAGKYEFDKDGMMKPVKHGIVAENGGLYMYSYNHIKYGAGLMELEDGSIVYVRSDGQLAVGEYYVTNLVNYTGTEYKVGDKLVFGTDGKLITE